MKNMNKSYIDLVKLLKKFDLDTKSFKFGIKSFKIVANAVTVILGLPNEGKFVKLDTERYTSTFKTRHFGENSKPSKGLVEEELHKRIDLENKPTKEKAKAKPKKKTNRGKAKKEVEEKEGEDKEENEVVDYDKDVVNLFLMLLCITLLYANSEIGT
ncbi:hypothetical protein L3X38_043695 [Prunus dulcis]|uniref:Uncharacterized protein n=1 Tax=Prunus dulcis TaxID=3755 RepID=A0AAD4UXB4_PRUDU|nr:hypothetical protein L3X38_043695 [Prunus dulcis]